MKRLPCQQCAKVKADAMAQLGLITQWQGRTLDAEAALRALVISMADFERHPQGRGYALSDAARQAFIEARRVLGIVDADNAQTAQLAEVLAK